MKHPGVDPSVDDNFAIRSASKNGRLEVVSLLLKDKRVDPSARDNIGTYDIFYKKIRKSKKHKNDCQL